MNRITGMICSKKQITKLKWRNRALQGNRSTLYITFQTRIQVQPEYDMSSLLRKADREHGKKRRRGARWCQEQLCLIIAPWKYSWWFVIGSYLKLQEKRVGALQIWSDKKKEKRHSAPLRRAKAKPHTQQVGFGRIEHTTHAATELRRENTRPEID